MKGDYRLVLGAVLALALMAPLLAGCGGGGKKSSTATVTAAATNSVGTAKAGSATVGSATAVISAAVASSTPARPAAVQTTAGGTIVAGGTPITPAEATSIALTPAVTAAVTPLPDAPTPGSVVPGTATPLVEGTPLPPNPPNPPPSGADRPNTIRFESYTGISAGTTKTFDVVLVAANVTQPYQGYQWTIHRSPNIRFVAAVTVEAAGLPDCTSGGEPAVNQTLGGCIKIGDKINAIYNGPVARLTFQCMAAGAGNIRMLNTAEAIPYGSDFGDFTGAEFGGTSTDPLPVVCL